MSDPHDSGITKLLDAARKEKELLKLLEHGEGIRKKIARLEKHMEKEIFGEALPAVYLLAFPDKDVCVHSLSHNAIQIRIGVVEGQRQAERLAGNQAGVLACERRINKLKKQIVELPGTTKDFLKFQDFGKGERGTRYVLKARIPGIGRSRVGVPPLVKVLSTPLKMTDMDYLVNYYLGRSDWLEAKLKDVLMPEITPIDNEARTATQTTQAQITNMHLDACRHILYEHARELLKIARNIFLQRKNMTQLEAIINDDDADKYDKKTAEDRLEKVTKKLEEFIDKTVSEYLTTEGKGGDLAKTSYTTLKDAAVPDLEALSEFYSRMRNLETYVGMHELAEYEDHLNQATAGTNANLVHQSLVALHANEELVRANITMNLRGMKEQIKIARKIGEKLHEYGEDAKKRLDKIEDILFEGDKSWFTLYKKHTGGGAPRSRFHALRKTEMFTRHTIHAWIGDDYNKVIKQGSVNVLNNLYWVIYDLIAIQEYYFAFQRILRLLILVQLNNKFIGIEEETYLSELVALEAHETAPFHRGVGQEGIERKGRDKALGKAGDFLKWAREKVEAI